MIKNRHMEIKKTKEILVKTKIKKNKNTLLC